MMRKLLTTLLGLGLAASLHAQEEGANLTLPSSPAFSILNFEPTAVLKPTSNKDLATDVLSAFDKDGKLLMNLGLEVMPYWLQSRPTLSRSQYLNPSVGQQMLQSLSLSAATVKDSATGDNKLGAGFRFKVLNGRPVDTLYRLQVLRRGQQDITNALNGVRANAGNLPDKQACIDAVMGILQTPDAGLVVTPTQVANFKALADSVAATYTGATLSGFMDTLIQAQVASYQALAAQVGTALYLRKGWILEFAGASAFNTTNHDKLERLGLWGNLSNYISANDAFTLTARYMWNHRDTAMSNFDAGLAYLRQENRYNISVEAMLRWYAADIPDRNQAGESILRSEKKLTWRLAATASYSLTSNISINLSIGKGFADPFISTSSFFSMLGVNYSIFSRQIVTDN